MNQPVDLLLITWNRREYVEKTLANLMGDPADFRLYCWDNGSTDGAADIIAGIDDPRVVERHLCTRNVKQREPCLWFFEHARSDIIGKVDDDLLVPHGWTERIAPLLRGERRFGMLGCWVFMPEDWDEELARHRIVEMGAVRIHRSVGFAGAAFLARKKYLCRYVVPPGHGYGLPVDREKMSLNGLINGCPLPILMAHHMDDPRSPHCLMNRHNGMGQHAALTARVRQFQTPKAYAEWIVADARRSLLKPFDQELAETRRARRRFSCSRLFNKARRAWSRLGTHT